MRTTPEVPFQAAEELAKYLRENPERHNLGSDDLAVRFGLPAGFVQEVVRSLRSDLPQNAEAAARKQAFTNHFVAAFQSARRSFARLTVKPVRFIAVSTLVTLLVGLAIGRMAPTVMATSAKFGFTINSLGPLLLALGLLFVHCLCYFRFGMARYVLYGALTVYGTVTPFVLVQSWLETKAKDSVGALVGLVALSVGMLFLMAVYAGFCMIWSTVGGYVRVKQFENVEQHQTRQQLLHRLFDVQERLKNVSEGNRPNRTLLNHPIVQRLQSGVLLYGCALDFIGSSLGMLADALVRPNRSAMPNFGELAIFMSFILVGMLFQLLAIVVIGFGSRGIWVMFRNLLILAAVGYVPPLIRTLAGGGDDIKDIFSVSNFVIGSCLTVIIASIAYFGRQIEERAAKDRQLQDNNPAALLAEMVKIQWRLNPTTHTVCVMVVDAAKSSTMKANADPFVVEWTFREYQTLIERVSHKFCGRIHSTAGDGAVVAFQSCAEAFEAAKTIHTEIETFNHEQNRLALPFRLRIGLHSGEVVAELDKVQFTGVIDTAAHIEAAAPIEGIAVSEAVAKELEGERFAALEEAIDGQRVLIALAPKLLT